MTTVAPPRPPGTASTAPTPRSGALHGTGSLVRLALRRDRILLPAWLVGFSGTAAFSVAATRDLYTDESSLASAADLINATAAFVALYGRIYEPTSLGAVSLIKMTAFGAALVAVLFVFLTVRHTRAEEESGRLELVSAGDVGRAAPLTAALIVSLGAGLGLGLLTAVGLALVGLPLAGCVAFGIGWGLTAWVFSAFAAVTAQVTTSARTAIGWGLIGVGLAYALRAVGDLASADPGFLSWLSPIGWSQQIRPFAGDRWWVVVIPVLATAGSAAAAYLLRSRRDLGAGLVPERNGPPIGHIGGVGALAWRLQRGMLVAWGVATLAFGAILGSSAHSISGFFDSPEMKKYLVLLGGEQGLTEAFLAAEVALMSVIVAGYGIAAVLRMRGEESSGHTEMLLAAGTTRWRWAASHLAVAFGGTAVLLLLTGASIGMAHGVAIGDPTGQTMSLVGAAAAHIPAAWVMVALAFALFAWAPLAAAAAAWLLYVVFILLGEFGVLWKVPEWVLDLSPFAHSPTLPGGDISAGTLLALVSVAVALLVVGAVGWRRRDIR